MKIDLFCPTGVRLSDGAWEKNSFLGIIAASRRFGGEMRSPYMKVDLSQMLLIRKI
jgi:hypothetical protein